MLLVLLVSGILGFRVGMAGFPDWQVAVETSQVFAGLVKYPAGNPFFIYHLKLWTILHQICAVFLRVGVSEIRLSLVISGLLGMVTFQALSAIVYAFSRDALIAIGASVLIYFTRTAEYGAVYGLFLMGTENTYGILGLSFCVLAVALIGAGWYRAGGFLLAVSPAVHPSLGVWTGAFVACAVLIDARGFFRAAQPGVRWFAGGCAVTLVSLLIQLVFIRSAPHAAPEGRLTSQQIAAFITFWDGHRKPVDLNNTAVLLNAGALMLASVWLLFLKNRTQPAALFFLRFVIVTAVVSLALVFVTWIPPDKLPTLLLVLMPGRVLNFDAFVYVALLIGLIGSVKKLWSYALLLVLTAGLAVGDHTMLWDQFRAYDAWAPHFLRPLWMISAASILVVIGGLLSRRNPSRASGSLWGGPMLRAGTIAIMVATTAVLLTFSRPRSLIYRDRTNDVFFARVAAGQGLLATAGDLHLIQLKTRRPVLLDGGGLDGLMYSLDGGPAMVRILQEVYGLDVLHPPDEARGAGRIPPLATQKVWEGYSQNRWREIRARYGVTQVLTYADWELNLPIAAQSRRLLLWNIPE